MLLCELSMDQMTEPLFKTPLHSLHVELGAKLVPFAGYDMPVQYPTGILAEHAQTRERAGLFDVSHMGQIFITSKSGGGHEAIARALETLVPGDIAGLKPGQMRYTLFLNEAGGILDDLMVTRSSSEEDDGSLFLIVNAACKQADFDHLVSYLGPKVTVVDADERALLALQGPASATVMARHCPAAADLTFMTATSSEIDGVPCHISRSGYTGEDGYEISIPADQADAVARALLNHNEVEPVGLGARDSLRLEAGLCLYGHDIDTTTTPVEASLTWAISKRRRQSGGFPGADQILSELETGPTRKRVGIKPDGRAPAREGTQILSSDGQVIGQITSGTFGPSVGAPVAMGYVERAFAKTGQEIALNIRGKTQPAKVAALPFVKHNYYRGGDK